MDSMSQPSVPQYTPPPAKEPSRRGRRKIAIEYIPDKSRRQITFSKRKAGIMKKAYELATLTGTQVLLLVASESGHVYTFATPKLQPLITEQEGKNLIQNCLNAASNDQENDNQEQDSPTSTIPYSHKREMDPSKNDEEEQYSTLSRPLKTEQKFPDYVPPNNYPPASSFGNNYQQLYGRQVPPVNPPNSLPHLPSHPPNYPSSSLHPPLPNAFPPYGYSTQQPPYNPGGGYLMRSNMMNPQMNMHGSLQSQDPDQDDDDDEDDDEDD
jgi:hypothetical protein